MTKKNALILTLIFQGIVLPAIASDSLLQNGDRVAICGDSITAQKLYSLYLENYFLMCKPASNLEAVQLGQGGEVTWGFMGRMVSDVLPFKPTVATVCYGMNDGGYSSINPQTRKRYHDSLMVIVKRFQENGVRLVVVSSPGVVDSITYDIRNANRSTKAAEYNEALGDLGEAAESVVQEAGPGVVFANTHANMMTFMASAKAKRGEAYHVGGADGVHPAANGHLVMAYSMLKALGCDGDIGVITYDSNKAQASSSAGHKVISASNGVIEIESSRYPFCFFGDPADPTSTRGAIDFLPFNEELNRFMLKVTNAPAKGMKVTWGKESKAFSASQLEEGINLASEFLDNPFCEPFQKVQAAVQAQQDYEGMAVYGILRPIGWWRKELFSDPKDLQAIDQISQTTLAKAQTLQEKASAAVVPVRHQIRLDAITL